MASWRELAWWREREDRLRALLGGRLRGQAARSRRVRRLLAYAWMAFGAWWALVVLAWGLVLLPDDLVPRALEHLARVVLLDITAERLFEPTQPVFAREMLDATLTLFLPLGYAALVVHPLALAAASAALGRGLLRERAWAARLTTIVLVVLAGGSLLAVFRADRPASAHVLGIALEVTPATRAVNLLVGALAALLTWAMRPGQPRPAPAETEPV